MWRKNYINEVLKIKELFSCFERNCPRDYDFIGEQHDFWECLYVKSGTLCVSADERVYRLGKNQLIFHKPLEFHKFYVTGGTDAEIMVFSFSLEGELSGYFENKVFSLSAEQEKILYSLLEYLRKKSAMMDIPPDKHIYHRYLYVVESSEAYAQMTVTYIYQLFLSLADGGDESEVYRTVESGAFEKAVNHMQANINRALSVEEIAEHCNVSRATLKRIFARYAGIGIHKYFLGLKIKRATQLLKDGAGVRETAEKLGFSSQGYFSSAYKRETGKSPSEI